MITEILQAIIHFFFDFSIYYFVSLNLFYGVLLVLAVFSIRKQLRSRPLAESMRQKFSFFAPPISILAPAFNEEASVAESVRSFLMLNYPRYEVVVINDGSRDRTMEILKEAFLLEVAVLSHEAPFKHARVVATYRSKLHPNLIVIDKENGGKADALNVGISYCRNEIFCAVDSDSLLEEDALIRIAMPFIEDPERTIASGGTIRVANGSEVRHGRVVRPGLPRHFVEICQVIEYTRAFLCGRIGWNVLNATLVISGAFGLFSKKVVIDSGGYLEKSVGEDMELIMRMHRHCIQNKIPYSVVFVPDPVCWTEAPSDFGTLSRQRDRWQRGLAETLGKNLDLVLNPRYGVIGLVAMPYFLVVELLGPVIEVLSYLVLVSAWCFGMLDTHALTVFLIVGILYGVLMTLSALMIDELYFSRTAGARHFIALTCISFVESLGYRQITSFWRLRGLYRYFRGAAGWGQMKRKGFGRAA